MEVIIDPAAGFCTGVKRTIRLAEQALSQNEKLYAPGELIHNRSETDRLEGLGLITADHSILDRRADDTSAEKLLIRAHGEPPITFRRAETSGWPVIDGTCPVVRRSQKLAQKYSEKGYQVLVVGKPHHPEVLGILGYCSQQAAAVLREADLNNIDLSDNIFVLAQTTIEEKTYRHILEALEERGVSFETQNTVCRFIARRDRQIAKFAQEFNVVVMVGGRHSSNTRLLFEVCREQNRRSFWIEEPGEIDAGWFDAADRIGITGSASTPPWLMEQVQQHIQKLS